ncbi:MAG: ATP-binding protein [Christensenellaceae bacterium]|jgi:DNA replication protein DnaC|nr:ATP-binding protein [Christensenellaceae bacterium]
MVYYDRFRLPKSVAMRVLSQRRSIAEMNAETRHRNLFNNDATFKALFSEWFLLSMEASRQQVEGLPTAKKARKDADVVFSKYKEYLQSIGLDENYRAPAYLCKICNDTGYLNGKFCACFKKLVREIASNVTTELVTDIRSFDKITAHRTVNPKDLPTYKKFYAFLDDFSTNYSSSPYKIVFTTGKPGSGKTFALSVFYNKVLDDGGEILMLSAIKLNELFLRAHTAPLDSRYEILELVYTCDILIIDDLGIEPIYNNVTAPYLRSLLDQRDTLTTLFSTNLSNEEITDRYGTSILSRFYNKVRSKVVELTSNTDLRIKSAADATLVEKTKTAKLEKLAKDNQGDETH